jgi:hypothetical protein
MDIQICNSECDHIALYKADLLLTPDRNGNNGVTFQTQQMRNF